MTGQKLPIIRSKDWTDAARDQQCVCCGVRDGTVVAAHYQGIRGDRFGRGGGRKGHDIISAFLCSRCHNRCDNYDNSTSHDPFMRKVEGSEQFMYFCARTLIQLWRDGKIGWIK